MCVLAWRSRAHGRRTRGHCVIGYNMFRASVIYVITHKKLYDRFMSHTQHSTTQSTMCWGLAGTWRPKKMRHERVHRYMNRAWSNVMRSARSPSGEMKNTCSTRTRAFRGHWTMSCWTSWCALAHTPETLLSVSVKCKFVIARQPQQACKHIQNARIILDACAVGWLWGARNYAVCMIGGWCVRASLERAPY